MPTQMFPCGPFTISLFCKSIFRERKTHWMLLCIEKIGLVFAFRDKIFKKMDNKFVLSFKTNLKIGPVLRHVHQVIHPRCFAFLFPRETACIKHLSGSSSGFWHERDYEVGIFMPHWGKSFSLMIILFSPKNTLYLSHNSTFEEVYINFLYCLKVEFINELDLVRNLLADNFQINSWLWVSWTSWTLQQGTCPLGSSFFSRRVLLGTPSPWLLSSLRKADGELGAWKLWGYGSKAYILEMTHSLSSRLPLK